MLESGLSQNRQSKEDKNRGKFIIPSLVWHGSVHIQAPKHDVNILIYVCLEEIGLRPETKKCVWGVLW